MRLIQWFLRSIIWWRFLSIALTLGIIGSGIAMIIYKSLAIEGGNFPYWSVAFSGTVAWIALGLVVVINVDSEQMKMSALEYIKRLFHIVCTADLSQLSDEEWDMLPGYISDVKQSFPDVHIFSRTNFVHWDPEDLNFLRHSTLYYLFPNKKQALQAKLLYPGVAFKMAEPDNPNWPERWSSVISWAFQTNKRNENE